MIMNKLKKQHFSILELIAAVGVATLLMTMAFGLITTTRKTHLRAQQQSQAIRLLDNTVERLSAMPTLTLADADRCLQDEFSKAVPLRKHELEAVVVANQTTASLIIRLKEDKRPVAQVEVPYAD